MFDLGDFVLQSGATLREAKLAFKTHGRLSAAKSNAIVYPTPYSAHHSDIEWLIGPGKALDPEKYFIIVPDMLGNGLSSSPSNTPPPYDRGRFPSVTIQDNVAAQHRLVTEAFGISRVALVVVHGGAADLPVGREPPRHGGAHRSVLRDCEDDTAQFGLPGGGQSGADCGHRLAGRLV
jgi:homoserine acetyltransferase